LLDNNLSIYQQAQKYNINSLEEHDVKIRLDRFLFSRDEWDKPCSCLSGGEKMRLIVCCLNIYNKAPDIIVLDEPTNNLDITNIKILSNAIKDYKGTVLVISHNRHFLKDINVERRIDL
jgi:ATPase subunit of ABC transporter with duplicated ATPase domains